MNVQALVNNIEGKDKGIRYDVSNNFTLRILAEFIGAFILIFIINFGLTLGEVNVPFFHAIYNVNILTALWIGTWTFISFLVAFKFTISCNFVNLVINYRNKNIDRKEFWSSALFQMIGGILAATLVYLICVDAINGGSNGQTFTMGGTTTKIKGLFLNKPGTYDFTNSANPIKYGFAAIQGLVNAIAIVFLFFINRYFDNKYENGKKAMAIRYIILIVVISITTLMYANTTNFIRLLSPAIIDVIATGWDGEFLTTTLTFIAVQSIGLFIVYYSVLKYK